MKDARAIPPTMSEDQAGPYTVKEDARSDSGVVNGPDVKGLWEPRILALHRRDQLNTAFAAGRAMGNTVGGEVRPAVQWFAEQMEAALRRNDHKGGWGGMDHETLLMGCGDEMVELKHCWKLGNGAQAQSSARIVEEAADVANFAMMIADNHGQRIGDAKSIPSADQRAGVTVALLEEIKKMLYRAKVGTKFARQYEAIAHPDKTPLTGVHFDKDVDDLLGRLTALIHNKE